MEMISPDKYDYVAIDPGKTSGWAVFDSNGEIQLYGQVTYDDAVDEFNNIIHDGVKCVIVEDYRNHGWTQQTKWSRNETSKLIGKIETICQLKKVKLHLQPNTVKAIGYKWAGLGAAPSNHSISHQFDAIAHGVFWLQQNNIRAVGKGIK